MTTPTPPPMLSPHEQRQAAVDGALLTSQWAFQHAPRPQQTEILEFLEPQLAGDVPFLNVEAPTGVGKSPLAMTFARHANGRVLVPQNFLQQQYGRDWPDAPLLKGSANYTCRSGTKDHPSCRRSKCECKKQGTCPYRVARDAYAETPGALTSYAMFFAMLLHLPEPPAHPWIVADESHQLDEAIVSASEVAFTEADYFRHTGAALPAGYYEDDLAAEVMATMQGGLYRSAEEQEVKTGETPETVGWTLLADQIGGALADMRQSRWIFNRTESDPFTHETGAFSAKPLLPTHFFQTYLRSYRILALSATPVAPEVARKLYGVEVASCRVPSPFHVDNREILYRPVAKMSFRHIEEGTPKVVRAIERILAEFPDDKGIIHTASFKLTGEIYKRLSVDARKRIVLHSRDRKKQDVLDWFANSTEPRVLMSPSITEGLDLRGDAGRFNVIAKVPYPALGDPWVQGRKEEIPGWYDWRTALSLAQASGRTTRSEDDWSTTIILDQSFGPLFDGGRHLFPQWFSEAVR